MTKDYIEIGPQEVMSQTEVKAGEDSGAETDMNVVMTESGKYIEIQGTGENGDFSQSQLLEMMKLA